ncbi:hypothetical protein BHM03_00037936 [Ensete ventricosum]|nr:hypothetical protein BHM03_00037936 [Ensete ventricosum]
MCVLSNLIPRPYPLNPKPTEPSPTFLEAPPPTDYVSPSQWFSSVVLLAVVAAPVRSSLLESLRRGPPRGRPDRLPDETGDVSRDRIPPATLLATSTFDHWMTATSIDLFRVPTCPSRRCHPGPRSRPCGPPPRVFIRSHAPLLKPRLAGFPKVLELESS